MLMLASVQSNAQQTTKYVTSCDYIKAITTDTTTGILKVEVWTTHYLIDPCLYDTGRKEMYLQWNIANSDNHYHWSTLSNRHGENEVNFKKITFDDLYVTIYLQMDIEKMQQLKNQKALPDDPKAEFMNFRF